MKLLAFSDFHGIFGLINHFRTVRIRIFETQPDLLIFCGDFRNQISIPLLESRLRRLKFPAIYYVWGNSDEVHPEFELKIGINLHLKLSELPRNFVLVGIGGDEYDTKKNIDEVDRLLSGKKFQNLIFVSHVPPFNCCDFAVDGKHVGSREYRILVDKYRPQLCIFGHIHEEAQKSKLINNTTFWNVGPRGVLIDL
ncbi:MAG TPA: metallophosphoesterase [Candidatus Deferrimicrobium sp.]|nr:metallophosphoesterase [Candidatus Deferrimicrobium sp.]